MASQKANKMDLKLGLLLLTLLTVVSSQKCKINSLEGNCIRNIECTESLEDITAIEKDEECFTSPDLKITLEIKNVKMETTNIGILGSLSEKILNNIVNFKIINGQLQDLPDVIKKMKQLGVITLSHNSIKSIPDNFFDSFVGLTDLDLSHNDFSEIDICTLKTKKLTISHNKIAKLISDTDKDCFVIDVDLSYNEIVNIIDGYFDKAKELRSLDLSHNHIHSINMNKVLGKKMENINLSNNNLVDLIRSDITFEFDQMKSIDLSQNHITNIPAQYFANVKNLQSLNLSNNLLKNLNYAIFYALKSLKTLKLGQNKLNNIEKSFANLEKLETLDLSDNDIQNIHDAFGTTLALKILNLSNNRLINNATDALHPLEKLQSLDLSKNALTEINEKSFRGNNNLKTLNLADNEIEKWEPLTFKNTQITDFNFSNNKLKGSLKSSMLEGLLATKLDFSHGEITDIGPSCFSKMSTLETLWLNNNKITFIDPSAFDGTLKLQDLDLGNNQIDDLNLNTGALKSLLHLKLGSNQLQKCRTDVFENFVSLKDLDLSDNQITILETQNFHNMKQLENLFLNKNPVNELRKNCFEGLKNLKELILRTTYLISIEEDTLSNLKNLENFDASFSKITTIKQNAFKGNTKMKNLSLNNNAITDISDVLKDMLDLQVLNLNNNDIKKIGSKSFETLSHVKRIDLSNNKNLQVEKAAFSHLEDLTTLKLRKTRSVNLENNENSPISDLDLSSCGITNINQINPSTLKNIKNLNLCENKLTSIDEESFKNMIHLENLYLCKNEINFMDTKSFRDLQKLQKLDLSRNRLSEISYGTFNGLKKLNELNLAHNELTTFLPGNLPKSSASINLILDSNKIDHLDFRGFSHETFSKTTLSIGKNLIPCKETNEAKEVYKLSLTSLTSDPICISSDNKPNTLIISRLQALLEKIEEAKQTYEQSINISTLDKIEELFKSSHLVKDLNSTFDEFIVKNKKIQNDIEELIKPNSSIESLNTLVKNLSNMTTSLKETAEWVKIHDQLLNDSKLNELSVKFDETFKINQEIENAIKELKNQDSSTLLDSIKNLTTSFDKHGQSNASRLNELKVLITKTHEISNNQNLLSKSVSEIQENVKLNSNGSETRTIKTLSYISAFGVLTSVTLFIVKCVLNFKKKN